MKRRRDRFNNTGAAYATQNINSENFRRGLTPEYVLQLSQFLKENGYNQQEQDFWDDTIENNLKDYQANYKNPNHQEKVKALLNSPTPLANVINLIGSASPSIKATLKYMSGDTRPITENDLYNNQKEHLAKIIADEIDHNYYGDHSFGPSNYTNQHYGRVPLTNDFEIGYTIGRGSFRREGDDYIIEDKFRPGSNAGNGKHLGTYIENKINAYTGQRNPIQTKIKIPAKMVHKYIPQYGNSQRGGARYQEGGQIVEELNPAVVTPVPTLKEFYQQKAAERSKQAVQNILNLQSPLVPEYTPDPSVKDPNLGKHPHTCIYTITGMYGPYSQEQNNIKFALHPKRYGFEKIKDNQINVGDVIQMGKDRGKTFESLLFHQKWPMHMVMVTEPKNEQGFGVTYSNGGIDYDANNNGIIDENEKHMRYNKHNLNREDNQGFGKKTQWATHVGYRFTGTKKDKKEWRKEYKETYKTLKKQHGGLLDLNWNTNSSFEDTFNKYFYENPVNLRHPSFRVTDMRSDIQQTHNDANQWFNSIQGKPNHKESDFDSDTNPIVKYNLTHGTSLFNEDQMKGYDYLEDLLKTSQQKWDQNHEDWLSNPDAYDPVDASLYNGKRPEKVSDIISYAQFKDKVAEGKINDAIIGLTTAFLGADIAATGLLPTIAHWGTGSYLSDVGSKQLGKLGSNLDRRIGSNKQSWENAGNTIGSLAGWMAGWRAADKLLKPAAWTTLALTKGRMPNILMSTNYKRGLINHALNNNWLKFEPYKPTNVSGQLSLAYENGGILKGQRGLKPILKSTIGGVKVYKAAKDLRSIVNNTSLTKPILETAKVISDPKPILTSNTYYSPNFEYGSFDDISMIPEPSGIGYTGYTPTVQSSIGQRFVDDVSEAVHMANVRGKTNPVKTKIFDFTDMEKIGGGAESVVYQDPDNPDRVLKIIPHIGGARTKEQAIENAKIIAQGRNHLYNMPLSVEGVTSAGYDGYEYWYPVLSQEKLRLIPREELSTFEKEIAKFGQRIGISSSAPMSSVISESYVPENQYWSLGQRDFKPENIGFTKDGTLMGFDLHKSGGKIHIKKENRGKFTSYCGGKVTNECIARGKNSPNPAIRKRATFAANSRSWAKKRKNENGGIINWWKKVN